MDRIVVQQNTLILFLSCFLLRISGVYIFKRLFSIYCTHFLEQNLKSCQEYLIGKVWVPILLSWALPTTISYHVYKNRLNRPRLAASQFAKSTRTRAPVMPETAANVRACLEVKRPRTRTRFLVRFICESNGISMNWLMVLAEAEMRPTPIVEKANNFGSKTSTGARQKPPAEVAHT